MTDIDSETNEQWPPRGPRRQATCESCRRNDAPEGGRVCVSCALHERRILLGLYRAMARGCLRWDDHERAFLHKTGGPNGGMRLETINETARLAEIAREH